MVSFSYFSLRTQNQVRGFGFSLIVGSQCLLKQIYWLGDFLLEYVGKYCLLDEASGPCVVELKSASGVVLDAGGHSLVRSAK